MRREVFALVLCACGTNAPATSTFDAGRDEPPVVDRSPGPDDALDASVPVGVACTPGSVRIIASVSKMLFDGPRVDDDFVYWTEGEPEADADVTQGAWWSSVMVAHRAGKLGESPTRLFGTNSPFNFGVTPFFVVDATSAYWIVNTGGGFGAVMRGAKDGSSQQTLVAGIPTPRELEIAGATLFFVSGNSLFSIGVDGTSERAVAQTWTASEYAVGETHVYATDGGSIHRISRTTGVAEPLIAQTPGIVYEGLSVGEDGFVYAIEKHELPNGSWVKTADVLRVPTDGKTPSIVAETVQSSFPSTDRLFTASDGACLVYTTLEGVFRSCPGVAAAAIGPGHALEAPVIDATSVYWRAPQTQTTTLVYAACKL